MDKIPNFFDFQLLLPEITLAILGMVGLLFGAFQQKNNFRVVTFFAIASFAFIAYLVYMVDRRLVDMQDPYVATIFNSMLRLDPFAAVLKVMVLCGAAVVTILSMRFMERNNEARFEYVILMMFATLGMMLMISANDFISLYVGLELQSLSLYVLAAFRRDNIKSGEAGLKYFVLGALSSGMLLYGISMIYGYTGTTNFIHMNEVLNNGAMPLGLVIGVVLALAGFAFKISAVPFHMWTPDVYEGAPTPVTAFFAIAPKAAALALIVRFVSNPLLSRPDLWQDILVFMAAGSVIVGAVAALRQTNIKRLLAYSSIGHMGFALLGIIAANNTGIEAMVYYIAIYMLMSAGTFAIVLAMKRQGVLVEEIQDLSGLSKTHPWMALMLLVLMFSMAGIPPMAGFFAKLYVLLALVKNAGLIWLAVLAVLASVVSAYYYLRIVKIMYFDAVNVPLDKAVDRELSWVMSLSALSMIALAVYPDVLMQFSSYASALIYSTGY